MASLNAYLMFNGNCRKAMEFYESCLGGELIVDTFGESVMGDEMPKHMKGKVMHSMLQSKGIVLMGSDQMGSEQLKMGNNVILCLVCESREEIERLFSALSKGGVATTPLREEFFGTFGTLVDRFGINWMFQYSED